MRAQLELKAQGFEFVTLAERLGKVRRVSSHVDDAKEGVPALEEELERAVPKASEGIAFGHAAEVLARYSRLVGEAEQVLPWLRSEQAYRALGNLCLQLAHASLRMSQPEEAQARLVQCLRLVPGLDANPELFPDDLLERFVTARAETERVRRTLDIAVRGASDCQVRVQGHVHERLRPLAPGPYYVTLACATPVAHALIVDVAHPGQLLVINVDVEAALEVRPDELRLRDGDLAGTTLDRLLGSEGTGSAGEETPDALLLLFADPNVEARPGGEQEKTGAITLRARTHTSDVKAQVSSPADLPAALSALFGPLRSVAKLDASSSPQASAPPSTVPETSRSAALLLAALGAASQVAAWGIYARYHRLDRQLGETPALDRDEVSSDYLNQLNQRNRLAPWIGGLGLASGMTFVGATIAGLKPRNETPWWVWTSGGAGLALLAGSAVALSKNGDAEQIDADARRAQQTLPLAALLLGDAMAVLAVPLTHWARHRVFRVQGLAAPGVGLALRVD